MTTNYDQPRIEAMGFRLRYLGPLRHVLTDTQSSPHW
jgi:hypothetical protein